MLVRVAQLISGPSTTSYNKQNQYWKMKSYVWDQKPQTGKGKWFVPAVQRAELGRVPRAVNVQTLSALQIAARLGGEEPFMPGKGGRFH